MNNSPLFSVLIANYNDGKYLTQAINSVMSQSYQNWEIVIVDDCSIVNNLNHPQIHVYQNDRNYGCGYTKSRCVELAHGEICGFVDADDYIVNDALEIMVDAHIKNPLCSLVYSQFYYTDKDSNILFVSDHQCAIPDGESYLTCKKLGAISHFVTFKKDCYQKTEGINKSMLIAEDTDLYFKLEEVGKTLFIPKPLYFYRTDTGNNTSLGGEKTGQVLGWDVLARYHACKRRGLPINQYSFFSLEKIITDLANDSYRRGAESVRHTTTYCLGRVLLRPFRWLIGSRRQKTE